MSLSLEGDEATLCPWVSAATCRAMRGYPYLPAGLIFALATELENAWGNMGFNWLEKEVQFVTLAGKI